MINQSKLGLGPKDSMLSYLPLAHVYGRILEEVVLSMGGHIGYWRVRDFLSLEFQNFINISFPFAASCFVCAHVCSSWVFKSI